MDERVRFVARLLEGEKMTSLCREFAISRKTGYKIFDRYKESGLEALTDRSRRPWRYGNQLPQQVEAAILNLKREKPYWGARKIRERLLRRSSCEVKVPARSTIHALLDRHCLVQRQGRKRNHAQGTPLSLGQKPNELWCTDYKGEFRLGNKEYCYPLTVTDHASRFLLLCEALESTCASLAFTAFQRLFQERGLPCSIRSDNDVPFASPNSLFNLSKLSVWWLRLGITIERIQPGHPQQNGRHGRDTLVRRVKETGMPAAATNEMTALLEKPDYFSARNLPSDSEVVATFRDWLTAAKSQPAGQHAGSLLAADRVLDFLDHDGVQVGEAARAAMKSFGVEYVHDELAGGDVYTHGLLKQAKALAPPGPAGDEVLLFQMERGFDETGMCSAGAEEFSQVIQQGESLLAGARSLPMSTLSSLHFMVGDAYATIVWLAKTTDTEYHDPKKYQQAAELARAKALEHYRAAFNLEHGTARAQKTWKDAWRLAAGLPPTRGRYFCIYD